MVIISKLDTQHNILYLPSEANHVMSTWMNCFFFDGWSGLFFFFYYFFFFFEGWSGLFFIYIYLSHLTEININNSEE